MAFLICFLVTHVVLYRELMDEARLLFEALNPQKLLASFGNDQRLANVYRWSVNPEDCDWLFERYVRTEDTNDVWRIDGQGRPPEFKNEFLNAVRPWNPELAERIRKHFWGSTVRDNYLKLYRKWLQEQEQVRDNPRTFISSGTITNDSTTGSWVSNDGATTLSAERCPLGRITISLEHTSRAPATAILDPSAISELIMRLTLFGNTLGPKP